MAQGVSGAPATPLEVHVTGRRILATIVDGLIFGVLFAVMSALFGTVASEGPAGVDASLPAIPTLVYVILIALYYILLEGYLGQTPGKMLFSIKVVREDNGELPGPRAAAIRTILRVLDGLLSYLVAFVAVLVSSENKRLGDMAAHTLVIRK